MQDAGSSLVRVGREHGILVSPRGLVAVRTDEALPTAEGLRRAMGEAREAREARRAPCQGLGRLRGGGAEVLGGRRSAAPGAALCGPRPRPGRGALSSAPSRPGAAPALRAFAPVRRPRRSTPPAACPARALRTFRRPRAAPQAPRARRKPRGCCSTTRAMAQTSPASWRSSKWRKSWHEG